MRRHYFRFPTLINFLQLKRDSTNHLVYSAYYQHQSEHYAFSYKRFSISVFRWISIIMIRHACSP